MAVARRNTLIQAAWTVITSALVIMSAGIGYCTTGETPPGGGEIEFTSTVIYGRGVRGPYLLPYAPVVNGSESLFSYGTALYRQHDYQIDYTAGVVQFTRPLDDGMAVTVRYGYHKGAAARSVDNVMAPAVIHHSQRTDVNLLYEENLTGTQPLSTMGMDASHLFRPNLKVTTLLMMDQTGGSPTADNNVATLTRRAAMGTSATYDLPGTQLSLAYSRAGKNFTNPTKSQFKPGAAVLSLGAKHRLSNRVAAHVQYSSESQEQDGKTTQQATKTAGVDMSGPLKSQLTASISEDDLNGDAVKQTRAMGVQSKPLADVTLGANVTEVAAPQTDSLNRNVRLFATRGSMLSVSGELSTATAGSQTVQTQRIASIQLTPFRRLQLASKIGQQEAGNDMLTGTEFQLVTKPLDSLELRGTYATHDAASAPGSIPDSLDLCLKAHPTRYLELETRRATNPDTSLFAVSPYTIQTVNMTAKPLAWLSLTGGYETKDDNRSDAGSDTTNLKLTLTLGQRHSLFTSLALSNAYNGTGAPAQRSSIYGLGYSYRTGNDLNLSLEGKWQDAAAGAGATTDPAYELQGKFSIHF